MNINNFFNKDLKNDMNKIINYDVKEFIQNLSDYIKHYNKNLINNSKFIVTDINNDNVTLINIDTNNKIVTQDFSKKDLVNLNLGSSVIYKDNEFKISTEQFEIKNPDVKADLEDLFFNINDEKDDTFLVKKIDADKLYLTNTREGGYFSISKEKYKDFNVGDLLTLENGIYKRQE